MAGPIIASLGRVDCFNGFQGLRLCVPMLPPCSPDTGMTAIPRAYFQLGIVAGTSIIIFQGFTLGS